MPGLHDTAYPRFKKRIRCKELEQIYTPSVEEINFARNEARGESILWFLCLLKTFQRLGYFVQLKQIPAKIVNHIAAHLGYATLPDPSNYDRYPTRVRHLARIRNYLNIRAFDEEGAAIVKAAIAEACQTKEDLADIINVAIEELVRHRYELPAFSKLHRLAYNGRARANNGIYQKIMTNLTHQDRARLNRLFKVTKGHSQSPWQNIKADPPKLTLKNLRQHIEHVKWLERHSIGAHSLAQIADVKNEQFAAVAKTLNAPRMARLMAAKRYTLAVALIAVQKATALDDWSEYHQQIGQYGAQVELPVDGIAFVNHTHDWLQGIALTTDDAFPENEDIRIEQGRPIIRKVKTASKVEGLERFEAAIAQRLKPVTILDVLNYTRQWIGWDKCFGPLSGFDAKLDNPDKHYIVIVFCYGCNMSPIQTARSIKDLSRYQIAWVNQRHVTEEKLNQAIVKTISSILRKLGTYSRKNMLYQAFRELGRVVRTAFLLEYLNSKELRDII